MDQLNFASFLLCTLNTYNMITHIQSGVRECEEMIMQGARMKQTIQNILKESTGQRRRKCSAGSEEVQGAWVEVQGGIGASAGRRQSECRAAWEEVQQGNIYIFPRPYS